jgi:phenylpropionate dioxygenase-like ring-hydroxylating dioxygenase large terminal subunit
MADNANLVIGFHGDTMDSKGNDRFIGQQCLSHEINRRDIILQSWGLKDLVYNSR